MGQKQLAILCKACGKDKIKDTKELHDLPVVITLETKKGYQNVKSIKPFMSEDGTPFVKPESQEKTYNADSDIEFY